MAAAASFLEEELCCAVCSDFFKDPVVLKCSHSFCRVCLQKFWKQKSSRECPLCRRKSSVDDPPVSVVLKNVVESYLQQRSVRKVGEKSESRCSLHGKKLLFFCEDDQELLCVVCQTSKKHRDHQLCPLEEAVQDKKEDLRVSLIPLKEKLEKFTKVKEEFEETSKLIKSQSQQTEKKIKEEFEELHQFLREEEEARLAILRVEEMEKSDRMKEKIENISKHVSTLSEKIRDIEKAMGAEDTSFLKTIKDTKEKAQCSLQDPELASGALIDVAKHLNSLKIDVCEKMLETMKYTAPKISFHKLVLGSPSFHRCYLAESFCEEEVRREVHSSTYIPPPKFSFHKLPLGAPSSHRYHLEESDGEEGVRREVRSSTYRRK